MEGEEEGGKHTGDRVRVGDRVEAFVRRSVSSY